MIRFARSIAVLVAAMGVCAVLLLCVRGAALLGMTTTVVSMHGRLFACNVILLISAAALHELLEPLKVVPFRIVRSAIASVTLSAVILVVLSTSPYHSTHGTWMAMALVWFAAAEEEWLFRIMLPQLLRNRLNASWTPSLTAVASVVLSQLVFAVAHLSTTRSLGVHHIIEVTRLFAAGVIYWCMVRLHGWALPTAVHAVLNERIDSGGFVAGATTPGIVAACTAVALLATWHILTNEARERVGFFAIARPVSAAPIRAQGLVQQLAHEVDR